MGKNTLFLSSRKARAAAHRKMAMSALWRDSSAKCRLERYNHHMAIARRLESEVAK